VAEVVSEAGRRRGRYPANKDGFGWPLVATRHSNPLGRPIQRVGADV